MSHAHSSSVQSALAKLGSDIRSARKRQRIKVSDLALRVGVSAPTMRKIERGDPTVQLGYMAQALDELQMLDGLSDIAFYDRVGLAMEEERLPKRIQ